MKIALWPRDSIARRFALTVVLAVVVTWSLVGLFELFGGVWAQPTLERSGLLDQAADMVRIIEAAPPPIREHLASAATTRAFRVGWYPATSPVSTVLEQTTDEAPERSRAVLEKLLDDRLVAVILKPNGPSDALMATPEFRDEHTKYPHAYVLAVRYSDGSWLVFTVPEKLWGLPWQERWAIWLGFLTVSIGIVSTIATRQLVRPIRKFAEAIRLFGTNPQAPPIAETGPRELTSVITSFNEMQAQIQKFVAYRTAMLAAISHDLRTPLTRIRLRGELIEDEAQQARLFRDVDELQTMVDGALAFFRGDADEEAVTSFDLPGVLQTIANDYADQDIEIAYAGPSHAVYRGRPFALKRAFTNLIENAVKYGTPPTIELACQEKTITILVRDQGPGISTEALERVFTPFYRLESSRNRTTGGVGLGLTAALAIVRGHGGDIVLSNLPAGGLGALVTLPRVA
ncbi:MAG: histidine kinase [Rhodospirillales bacterium]|jgi:signal transduction histidine kinase|nr:histidine kinase [Rhodospirillales bacterium]